MALARARLVWSILLAFAMLLPVATAAAPVQLRAPMGATTTGPASALLAVLHADGFSFQADAASIIVETRATNFTFVPGPPGARPLTTVEDNHLERTTAILGAGALRFVSGQDKAGFLLEDLGGDLQMRARHAAPLAIRGVESPHVAGDEHVTSNNRASWAVSTDLTGALVAMTGGNGDYELRGDFALQLYGITYEIATGSGHAVQNTGDYETGPARGRFQLDRVILHDATIRVHSPGEATLYSAAPLLALPAGGVLDILDDAGNAVGHATVATDGARLDQVLAPQSAVVSPVPQASVASTPWLLVAAGVLVVGLLAFVAWRRRERDDLALALHAMEERRFRDALRPLRRLRAKTPHDPAILLDEAICLEETGALREARAAYEATLAAWPTHAEAHYFLARTLARLRLHADASRHLARALELDARLDELARRDAMLGALPTDTGVSA